MKEAGTIGLSAERFNRTAAGRFTTVFFNEISNLGVGINDNFVPLGHA